MRVLLMAAVLAAAPMAAFAAAPPSAPPSSPPAAAPDQPASPEALALARQLVEATGATRDFSSRLQAMIEPINRAVTQSLPADQQAKRAALSAVVQQEISADAPLFIDTAVQAYARTYTPGELRGLLAFYKTPLGQTMVVKQGVLAAEIGRANAKLVPTLIRDVLTKVCAQTTCPPEVVQQLAAKPGA